MFSDRLYMSGFLSLFHKSQYWFLREKKPSFYLELAVMHTDFGFSQIPFCEENLFEFHENDFKNKTIVFIHKQNCVYTQKKKKNTKISTNNKCCR